MNRMNRMDPMNLDRLPAGAGARRAAGFSIVELMIAVALGLIVLAALTTFFVQTSANRYEMERNTRQIENGRYAIDSLREDVALSGFYADLAPGATPAWKTNDACPPDLASLGFALVPAYAAPVPVFGYALGAGAPTCLGNLKAGSDVLVVRRFNTESLTLAAAQAATPASAPANAQWYVQISECPNDNPATPFVLDVGSGSNFTLHKLNCTAIADLWRLREQVYYIRDCSVTCSPSDGVPTLVRLELESGAMKVVPLVEGIEEMHVDYGIDNTADGLPDVWSRCDAATPTPCTAADWANVTAVKVYVLSRNLETSRGYVDNKTYAMGLYGSTVATSDGYKRHVYMAQVNLPNRSGSREPQYVTMP
jgi:type IV pilus assembly protein PilW